MKVKTIINIDYFKELQEQIYNESKWNKDKFVVFDHEAGTGKRVYSTPLGRCQNLKGTRYYTCKSLRRMGT